MEQNMNKSELIKTLAEENEISTDDATIVVNTFFDSIRQALLAEQRVEIRGLGSFKIKAYQGYAGRNPKTGDIVNVAPKKLPFFRAGKELKEHINS
jgi:integration host factor subunit beta